MGLEVSAVMVASAQRTCYALAGIIMLLGVIPAVRAEQLASMGPCHMEYTPGHRFFARMYLWIKQPGLRNGRTILLAPSAPTIAHEQTDMQVTATDDGGLLRAQAAADESKYNRSLVCLHLNGPDEALARGIRVHFDYSGTTVCRRLVRGAGQAVPGLTDTEKLLFLGPSEELNFSDPQFQQWLLQCRLVRLEDERDIDFAFRAYAILRQKCQYELPCRLPFIAADVARSCRADCGGLSLIYAATLRANRIPARLLIGRLLKSSDRAATADNYHCKSEFFAEGIGWVPVDMAAAVSDKKADPYRSFGADDGNFLTMQIDPGIDFDSIWFGKKHVAIMQKPCYSTVAEQTEHLPMTFETEWQVR